MAARVFVTICAHDEHELRPLVDYDFNHFASRRVDERKELDGGRNRFVDVARTTGNAFLGSSVEPVGEG